MPRFLPFLVLCALLAPAGAHALPIQAVTENDGTIAFCIAEKTFADGRALTVAHSPVGQINLGFTIPDAGFKPGGRYDLLLSLNAGAEQKVRAEALDTNALLIQMGANPAFRKSLAASSEAQIGTSAKKITFALPAMGELLIRLQACAEAKGEADVVVSPTEPEALPPAPVPVASDPEPDIKAAKAPQPSETPPVPNKKVEQPKAAPLPERMTALLKKAGLGDAEPLSLSHMTPDKRPADHVWRLGEILGGVRERPVPGEKNLTDLIGLHMQGLRDKCAGKFKGEVARVQSTDKGRIQTAEAVCAPSEGMTGQAVYVEILFVLTPKNVFTIFTHEAPEPLKDQAIAARDNLAKVVKEDGV